MPTLTAIMELDNDDIDIGRELEKMNDTIEEGLTAGIFRDVNGNRIGRWWIQHGD